MYYGIRSLSCNMYHPSVKYFSKLKPEGKFQSYLKKWHWPQVTTPVKNRITTEFPSSSSTFQLTVWGSSRPEQWIFGVTINSSDRCTISCDRYGPWWTRAWYRVISLLPATWRNQWLSPVDGVICYSRNDEVFQFIIWDWRLNPLHETQILLPFLPRDLFGKRQIHFNICKVSLTCP